MPVIPFTLSERVATRRRNLGVFLSSAAVGTLLGIIANFLTRWNLLTYIETILILALSVLVALLSMNVVRLVLYPERLYEIIPMYLAFSSSTGMLVPITCRVGFIQLAFMKFRDGVIINSEPRKYLQHGLDSAQTIALDIAAYELLDWLTQKYPTWWAPKLRVHTEGMERRQFKDVKEVGGSVVEYQEIGQLLESNNIFFRLYGQELMTSKDVRFCVPKTTKIEISINSNRFELHLKNKYCTTQITLSKQGAGRGLFPLWGQFVGVNETRDYRYLQEHYGHIRLELEFKSSFSWFRSLYGSSTDYLNWIEDMKLDLEDYFSFQGEVEALRQSGKKIELD